MISSLKEHRLEIGLVLALAGIQFSIIIKSMTGLTIDLTNVIFFLSLVLIPDYSKLLSGCLPLHGWQMNITLGYNVYVAILAVVSGASMWASGTGTIYTLYTIVFILALMTNTREIDGEFIVAFTWASTGIFSVFLFYLVTDKFTNFGGTIQYLSSGADRLSLSVIAFYYLCSMLLFHTKNYFLQFLKIVFAIVAFYDVMACTRRGLMVALIIIFFYHLWQSASLKISSQMLFRVIGSLLLAILALWIAMRLIPGFGELIENYLDKLTLGVNTYFGNTSSGTDAAASSRNAMISEFPEIFNSGTLFQQLFGHGYAYYWMDVPYLEAFIDLGIFGGIWYLIVQLIIPVRIILRRTDSLSLKYAQYFAIIGITYNIYSGVCYGQYKFVPVVILIYVAFNCLGNHSSTSESNLNFKWSIKPK
ncbi:MAG: hypothetical protein LUC25_07165 [Ruminococcus sp.]|nr:hypothetical protein [Ruminococcus sp.]